MKRTMGIIALSLIAACGLFANGQRETVTVEGKLAVKDAIPSIVSGNKTYALPVGPFYQIAWENGIKVGDTVKAEGFVMEPRRYRAEPVSAPANAKPSSSASASGSDQSLVWLMPTKVWVNGKEINLSTVKMGPRGNYGDFDGRGMRNRRNGGRSGRNGADCPMWDDPEDDR